VSRVFSDDLSGRDVVILLIQNVFLCFAEPERLHVKSDVI